MSNATLRGLLDAAVRAEVLWLLVEDDRGLEALLGSAEELSEEATDLRWALAEGLLSSFPHLGEDECLLISANWIQWIQFGGTGAPPPWVGVPL